jgi:hypothetical protein
VAGCCRRDWFEPKCSEEEGAFFLVSKMEKLETGPNMAPQRDPSTGFFSNYISMIYTFGGHVSFYHILLYFFHLFFGNFCPTIAILPLSFAHFRCTWAGGRHWSPVARPKSPKRLRPDH